ncbi:MAG: restriction endonuclease subunit R [Faecalibacterium sp. CAG:74_58_120]|nr:MAG: restriction endonuclease subunit R [Faecalibacterium sp. CAG:74_58_120]
MKVELFPFQQKAVDTLRMYAANALNSYRNIHVPQVISLQAPTGSGKTIVMAALIEDIYFGNDRFAEQPDAIFVWLSDSPALNEQSRQKIDLKADKVRFGQCVTIEESSFDMEELEDGHIYFLNTQKLSKTGNLGQQGDGRTYTIWQTLENTAKNKADRLYFIIDEAHRGMQGREAGKATSIMQRFLKGSTAHHLSPMPVVIGMSATSDRFNKLIEGTTSTLSKVVVSSNEVRASGLLKDRILITYPDDPTRHNDMAVLQKATDEWQKKCEHWYQYSYEQHYAQVNPVFVIQVLAGSGNAVSATNLNDVLAKIEERSGIQFKENEVVHTFGSTGDLTINGLKVPHIEPEQITEDRRVRIVFFKENLSTGWDCPRAETMVSFRRAEDATYIAQLLGRMVRTPLQCHINVDDYLNDVRLFLPYFNRDAVKKVIDELQATEGGEIPTIIDSESLENVQYTTWTVHPCRRTPQQIPGQVGMDFSAPVQPSVTSVGDQPTTEEKEGEGDSFDAGQANQDAMLPYEVRNVHPQTEPTPLIPLVRPTQQTEAPQQIQPEVIQMTLLPEIDRPGIIKYINEQGFLTYYVRTARIHNYLRSLLDLASLLTQTGVYPSANAEVSNDVVGMIHDYAESLRTNGQYNKLSKQVLQFKLLVDVFDVFGETVHNNYEQMDAYSSDEDIDRQLRAADAKLGGFGFDRKYGVIYFVPDNPNAFKIDVILFAADENSITELYQYAERKFHELNDNHRRAVARLTDYYKRQYDTIVANSDVVTRHNLTLPETHTVRIDEDGKRYENHLYVDGETGFAQIKLNGWESQLIDEEAARSDFVCWLRNPSGRGSWGVCMPYEDDGETRATYPDFIIIRQDNASPTDYIVDILEPHNPVFRDNLGKARALAQYAADESKIGRVQLIREDRDVAGRKRFKRLDMGKGMIRNSVLHATSNDELDHLFDLYGIFE